MIERMLVKVSRPSYDSFGTASTRSTPRPPAKKTTRRTARPTAPTHALRRLPIIVSYPVSCAAMVRGGPPSEKQGHLYPANGLRARPKLVRRCVRTPCKRRPRPVRRNGRWGDAGRDAAVGLPREQGRRAG